ncbi:glycosyltransferase family 4 protein [Mucilaginibacter arboris]|uniref:Glycosyltransferase n=1 Tax=Mucilaginibacter arboris TaxID=2682090 RepID=A0A7K1SYT4_9SPHI|nr:glycosyltransferase family 4 protein [Mucilaginibacter arboris]MVN22472.1 glycosyltransferase [Mucilaginibacter arboris]
MHILIFSTVFYPVLGGIENLTLNLCKEFVKKGHQVKVITHQKQNKPLIDIEVYDTPGFIKTIKLFLWCDVYYMPNISLKGIWPLLFNPGKKWVVSQNDFSLSERSCLSLVKLFFIRRASKNISVSKSVAASLGTPSEIIYNCYDDAVFTLQNLAERTHDFIFVGRLVSQKGCDTLIKACNNLPRPFKATIVGDGPEMRKLQNLVKKSDLTDSITFTGTQNSVAIARILNQHKFLIIPSNKKEGFGIVVLEGLACGCRVIASNAGGLEEAVGSFGKLFESGNVQQLNQLLKEALNNTNQLNYTQQDLDAYLSNYKKHVVAQKYLSVFK